MENSKQKLRLNIRKQNLPAFTSYMTGVCKQMMQLCELEMEGFDVKLDRDFVRFGRNKKILFEKN